MTLTERDVRALAREELDDFEPHIASAIAEAIRESGRGGSSLPLAIPGGSGGGGGGGAGGGFQIAFGSVVAVNSDTEAMVLIDGTLDPIPCMSLSTQTVSTRVLVMFIPPAGAVIVEGGAAGGGTSDATALPWIDVTDPQWGGAVGGFNWLAEHIDTPVGHPNDPFAKSFEGLTDPDNIDNYLRNLDAFAAASAAARSARKPLLLPPGDFAVPSAGPGSALWTETNDFGIIAFQPAKTTLWHIGVDDSGNEDFGPCVHQRMIDGVTYWTATDEQSDAMGQQAIPPLTGFTINGLFARATDASGDAVAGSTGAAIGAWIGAGSSGYFNCRVYNYGGHTGPSEVDGLDGGEGTGESITGDIAVLFQNEPFGRDDGGNAFSEEWTFGPQAAIRKSFHSFVADGQMRSTSSFKGTIFEGMFIESANHAVEVVNSAWLYDGKYNIRGNFGGEVFRVGQGDTADGQGSRVTGTIEFQGETSTPGTTTFITMADHAWWFTSGRMDFWSTNGDPIGNDIPHKWRQFHHKGQFSGSFSGIDGPRIESWNIIHATAKNNEHFERVDNNTARVIGRQWFAVLKKGTKIRWDDDPGDSPRYARISSSTVVSDTNPATGNLVSWTQFKVKGDAFTDPRPLSFRYSHEAPPDYGPGGSGDDSAVDLIGGVENPVPPLITSLSGLSLVDYNGIGPVFEMIYDPGTDDGIINGDQLGQFGFGAYYSQILNHQMTASLTAYATGPWTGTSAPTELAFTATRSGVASADIVGTWGIHGIEVMERYTLSGPAAGQTGAPVLVTVESVASNSDGGAGQGTSDIAAYSIHYPRPRIGVEGRVEEKRNHAISGQPPAFQHAIWYANYPLARTTDEIADLSGHSTLNVDSTRGFPIASDPSDDRVVYVPGANGTQSFTYVDRSDTQFTGVVASSGFAVPAGTTIRSKAEAYSGANAIAGQGFLNVPTLGVSSETTFPVDGSLGAGVGLISAFGNYPGIFNNWAVGFYDLPGFSPQARFDPGQTFTQNLNHSGTLDNIQTAGYTSMIGAPAGTRVRRRYGLYVEDTGGGSGGGDGGYWAQAFVVPGGFPADVRSAFDDVGAHSMTLVGDATFFPTTGGNLTVETTENSNGTGDQHIAELQYGSRSGQVLSNVKCIAGHGYIQVGARVAFGALVDEQIGVLIGRKGGAATGATTLQPLNSGAVNIGVRLAIGGDGTEQQYGIQIRQVGTVVASGQSQKLGIYNEAPFRQLGPTSFGGNVSFETTLGTPTIDFTNATVVGLPGPTGSMHLTGTLTVDGTSSFAGGFALDTYVPTISWIDSRYKVLPSTATRTIDPHVSAVVKGRLAVIDGDNNGWSEVTGYGTGTPDTAAAHDPTTTTTAAAPGGGIGTLTGAVGDNITVASTANFMDPTVAGTPGEIMVQLSADTVHATSGVMWGVFLYETKTATQFQRVRRVQGPGGALFANGAAVRQAWNGFTAFGQDSATVARGKSYSVDHRIDRIVDSSGNDIQWTSNWSGTKVGDNLALVANPGGSYAWSQLSFSIRDGHRSGGNARSLYGLVYGMQENPYWDNVGFWDSVFPIRWDTTGYNPRTWPGAKDGSVGNTPNSRASQGSKIDFWTGLWISQADSDLAATVQPLAGNEMNGETGAARSWSANRTQPTTAGTLITSGRFLVPPENATGVVTLGAFGDMAGTGFRFDQQTGVGKVIWMLVDGLESAALQVSGGGVDFRPANAVSNAGTGGRHLGTSASRWSTLYATTLNTTGDIGFRGQPPQTPTGWLAGTRTGAAGRGTNFTTSITLPQLAALVFALANDLVAEGVLR